jgi:hypothetical protein
MDTQGMTPEEKAVIMQFMGQTYGQIHQQDQNIIGNSGNLKPASHKMKDVFEQTAHMPTIQQHPQQHLQQHPQAPPPAQPPPQVAPVTPEQAAQELAQSPPPVPVQVVQPEPVVVQNNAAPNQMELNLTELTKIDMLIDLAKQQNLLLKEINLKLDNGKGTTRGRKQK